MASNKPQQSAWKTAAPSTVTVADEGDILRPLKRVRDKYIAKAAELDAKAYGEHRELIKQTAAHYRTMADAVGRLIGLIDVVTLVDAQHEASVSVVRDALDKAAGEHDNTQA